MEKLQKWGSDASSIFEGDQLFFDIPVHKDDVYESLLIYFFSSGSSLFNQSDVLLLDHRIIVSKHTVEAAGFIFNNRSRDHF
jgi:hypothetical protein